MNLVYVVKRPLVQRDYERYGVEWALSAGHRVRVIDLSRALHPDLPVPTPVSVTHPNFEMHRFDRIEDLAHDAEALLAGDLVMLLIQSYGLARNTLAVLRMLKRVGTPYLILTPVLYPGWEIDTARPSLWKRCADLAERLRNADPVNSLISAIPPRWLGIPEAAFVVYNSLESRRVPNSLIGPETRSILAHSFDYDLHLAELADGDSADKAQAVFIDQYMPFHEDFDSMNARPIDAERYFQEMRTLFNRVEEELGLAVVIAAHPRADYSGIPDCFGERPVVYGETTRLIRESRLVILHTSTTFGYAALKRKPMLVATSRQLYDRQAYEKHYYEGLAAVLGTRPVFVDAPGGPELSGAMHADETAYRRHVEHYMKFPGAPEKRLWEIILEEVGGALEFSADPEPVAAQRQKVN